MPESRADSPCDEELQRVGSIQLLRDLIGRTFFVRMHCRTCAEHPPRIEAAGCETGRCRGGDPSQALIAGNTGYRRQARAAVGVN